MGSKRTREQIADYILKLLANVEGCTSTYLDRSVKTDWYTLQDVLAAHIEDEKIIIMRDGNSILFDLPRGREQPSLELEPMSH